MRKLLVMTLLFTWLGFLFDFNLSLPAHATTFCNIPQTSDGFVALRSGPGPDNRMIGKMRPGDEVMLDINETDRWIQVTWWRGQDRHEKGFEHKAGFGWMHKRFVGEECG
jgi:hypothetical protein